MPACRAPHLRPSLITSARAHDARLVNQAPNVLFCSSRRRNQRHASTAAALAPKPPSSDLETSFHTPVRTALHKTTSFIPRVLPARDGTPSVNTAEFWEEVLDGAYDRLNSTTVDAPARVVVHGCDEYSGARELVTALLEEPFAPDARKDSIRRRWREGPQNTERTITYGFAPSEHPASVRVPSTWLQQFPVPIEVCELPIVPLRNVSSSASYRTLFSSDVPIIVCNPVSTPLASLRSELSLILNHANAILVVVCSAESSAPYAEYLSKQFPQPLSVVFVDPSRALSAIRTLSAEPGSSIAVQRYQDNYAASGISKFTSLLQDKLSVTSAGGISALYAASAREQIRASLCACYNTLKSAERDVDAATVSSITLRDSVVELEARVGAEVLGGDSVSEVKKALARAKVEVKAVMDRLTWWRCVWRIDDIGDTVKTAVDKAWCRELEDRLIFHSGRLAASQDCLAKSTRTLLASYKPPSPLHSPVLQNTLLQIQSSPSYSVTPSALTSPVHARKMQLAYPTNMLHSTAQRVTLGMGMSVLAGFGTAWAGWADKLGILGDAMATGLELETAIGTGMLMSTLGVWWMVGRWEKAKRRWWKDWDRIGEGLERDLKATLQRTVREKVVIVPMTACEGLNRRAEARREEIETLKDELSVLEVEARQLDAKSTP